MLDAIADTLTDAWRGNPAAGARSPEWPRLRKDWLRAYPTCAACGTRKKLEVHHVRPVHVAPALELDWTNLMTLCRTCHLVFGHTYLWAAWNPSAVADAAWWLTKVRSRSEV